MTGARAARSVADRLAGLAATVVGPELPVRLRAWDGSESGPATGPVLVLRNRRAARRLLSSPASGFAEAYIAGDIDIDGDLAAALSALWAAWSGHAVRTRAPSARRPALLRAARMGVLGRRPQGPGAAAARRHQGHHCRLDPAVIAQHDDRSSLYGLLQDPAMVYSGGYFVDGPVGSLAGAQRDALELICRKLGLAAGNRHLDLDCGWGSLICYAAQQWGTRSTGVAHSRQQYEYVSKRIADAGLADRVQVRLADHPAPTSGADDGLFDAVSAIGLGGVVDHADHLAPALHRVLRPGGRALVQQLSHGQNAPVGNAFVETCIAPGVRLRPLGTTVSRLAAAGLEVRNVHALREHYEWTFLAWVRTLEQSWNEAVDLVGEVRARVWRLYLVGGALAFAENRVGVDQILAVRPTGATQLDVLRT